MPVFRKRTDCVATHSGITWRRRVDDRNHADIVECQIELFDAAMSQGKGCAGECVRMAKSRGASGIKRISSSRSKIRIEVADFRKVSVVKNNSSEASKPGEAKGVRRGGEGG